MKKKMPKVNNVKSLDYIIKKIKSERFKVKLKQVFTFPNICHILSQALLMYAGARLLLLVVGLIPPLTQLFIAILGLPAAAFTNKMVLLLVLYIFVMYKLLQTMFRMGMKLLCGKV